MRPCFCLRDNISSEDKMFWDKVAGVYDIFVNVFNRSVHKELRAVVADLIRPGSTVLECACGTGMLTEVMAPRCGRLVATDFSSKMLKRAERKCSVFENIKFEYADITCLQYSASSFDCVVAANVIHLVEDSSAAVAELVRVAKPGGTLVIPTYINKKSNGQDSGFSKTLARAGAGFKRQFDFDSYKKFISGCGLGDAEFILISGRVPCAVAIAKKEG